jgi:hypothetical protein
VLLTIPKKDNFTKNKCNLFFLAFPGQQQRITRNFINFKTSYHIFKYTFYPEIIVFNFTHLVILNLIPNGVKDVFGVYHFGTILRFNLHGPCIFADFVGGKRI